MTSLAPHPAPAVRPRGIAARVADRSAPTLLAALFVGTLFANAALWASRLAGA